MHSHRWLVRWMDGWLDGHDEMCTYEVQVRMFSPNAITHFCSTHVYHHCRRHDALGKNKQM